MSLRAGKVIVRLTGLKALVNALTQSKLPADLGLLLAKRYESFVKRRFVAMSRGAGSGGNAWAPHAESTKRARMRKGRGVKSVEAFRRGEKVSFRARGKKGRFVKGGKTELLRDTGTLFKALTIGAPGNLLKNIPGGVRFGIVGPGRHQSGVPIKKLALWHDQGTNRVPQRQIIVEPDEPTRKALIATTKRVVKKLIDKHSRR